MIKNKLTSIELGNRVITPNSKPYIIAEIGVNHEGSLEKAIEMVKSACDAGAHAVKFQTYKAGTLASKNSPAYWNTNEENFGSDEKSLFGNDGSEGKKGGDAPKDNPASDNIGEKPKAHPAPKVSADKSESPIAGKVK